LQPQTEIPERRLIPFILNVEGDCSGAAEGLEMLSSSGDENGVSQENTFESSSEEEGEESSRSDPLSGGIPNRKQRETYNRRAEMEKRRPGLYSRIYTRSLKRKSATFSENNRRKRAVPATRTKLPVVSDLSCEEESNPRQEKAQSEVKEVNETEKETGEEDSSETDPETEDDSVVVPVGTSHGKNSFYDEEARGTRELGDFDYTLEDEENEPPFRILDESEIPKQVNLRVYRRSQVTKFFNEHPDRKKYGWQEMHFTTPFVTSRQIGPKFNRLTKDIPGMGTCSRVSLYTQYRRKLNVVEPLDKRHMPHLVA